MQRWQNSVNLSSPLPACLTCHASNLVKNASIHNGKQNYKCKACGCQFVRDPQNRTLEKLAKHLTDELFLEKISLAEIARVAEVSEVWLQQHVSKFLGNKSGICNVNYRFINAFILGCIQSWALWLRKLSRVFNIDFVKDFTRNGFVFLFTYFTF